MARPLRYEAAEAVYHFMARGDGGKVEVNHRSAKQTGRRQMNTAEALEAEENNGTVLPDSGSRGAALPGEVFHGRGGDREQGVCECSVRRDAGAFHGEEPGRGAEAEGQWQGNGKAVAGVLWSVRELRVRVGP